MKLLIDQNLSPKLVIKHLNQLPKELYASLKVFSEPGELTMAILEF